MRTLHLFKRVVIVATVAWGCLMLPCATAAPPQTTAGYDLSHAVRFDIGATRLLDGDSITIDEIRGTSEKISVGNIYVIKGSYKLASQKRATLLASVTANQPKQGLGVPTQRTQSVMVDQGEGRFSLILYVAYEGNPHVSFYSDAGGSFANVYFGAGESLLKLGWWEKRN